MNKFFLASAIISKFCLCALMKKIFEQLIKYKKTIYNARIESLEAVAFNCIKLRLFSSLDLKGSRKYKSFI